YADEYDIYHRLREWGYEHHTVCHAAGEFARDEDGDGFGEVHVNTMEGFWSLLRSWLRPHRGVSQEKLPLDLGFFEFVHNVRKRRKALLGALAQIIHPQPCVGIVLGSGRAQVDPRGAYNAPSPTPDDDPCVGVGGGGRTAWRLPRGSLCRRPVHGPADLQE